MNGGSSCGLRKPKYAAVLRMLSGPQERATPWPVAAISTHFNALCM